MSDNNQTQFQTYSALLNKKRTKEEPDTSNQRRKVVQTQDGRIWYAPKITQAFTESQTDPNNTTTTTTTSSPSNTIPPTSNEPSDSTTIFLGSDHSISINPYGSFSDKSIDKEDHDISDKKHESKIRRQFRARVAKYVVNRLSRYYKNKRITNREDFKHLSRKFTHKFITWEDTNGNYKMDSKKKEKMKKMMDEYFKRHKVYSRKNKF